MSAPRAGLWARGGGVSLRRRERPFTHSINDGPSDGPNEALSDGLARALRDGIERGHERALPTTTDVEWFEVRAGGATVGLLALRRDVPAASAVTVVAVAIEPARRGHDLGARALQIAERRLWREGLRECYARVPRSNGRGLYFMLRAGYAPLTPPVEDGATWFRRARGGAT